MLLAEKSLTSHQKIIQCATNVMKFKLILLEMEEELNKTGNS